MTIYEMTATFGNLDGQTLRLEPGMNWIVAPNEWGKSTWCAFLVAMLYGIDTRERSGKENLAAKERYAPWSGKPMQGQIRLEFQGRDITIARRSTKRAPLGEFSATETETGLPIRELTAENCGQALLGVEKSVFQRSGFIHLGDIPVTNDEALRRRLNSLVTTGDESAQADQLARRLKELKNRCRYNKTGLIPECRARVEELEGQLHRREGLDDRLRATRQDESRYDQRLKQLELHARWLRCRENAANAQRLTQALEADEAARQRYTRQQARCADHLSADELRARLVAPQTAGTARPGWPVLAAALAVLCVALVLAVAKKWSLSVLLFAAAVVLGLVGVGMHRAHRQEEKELRLQAQRREGWLQELEDWKALERAGQEAEQARQYVRALRQLVRSEPEPEEPDSLTLSQGETEAALRETRERLGSLRQLRGEILGSMERLPQAESIAARLAQTRQRLTELERTETAIGYAQKALEEAMLELQQRFSPRIVRRAEEFLSRMTRGRYTRMQLSPQLALEAATAEEAMSRNQLWRSDGTSDQIYLALRLAVWEALMPGGPLVLDDALARFDAQRLEAAEELLRELAQQHQILVFSCR